MVIQSLPATCHEAAQLAINRVVNPSLSSVRVKLASAAALVYSHYVSGEVTETRATRALIHLEHAAAELAEIADNVALIRD